MAMATAKTVTGVAQASNRRSSRHTPARAPYS